MLNSLSINPLFQTGQALHRRPHVGARAQLQLRDPGGVNQRARGGGPDQVRPSVQICSAFKKCLENYEARYIYRVFVSRKEMSQPILTAVINMPVPEMV